MAYQVIVSARILWVGDGAGAMSVPSAQSLRFASPLTQVPGNDAPTTANITSAVNTAAANAAAQLNANIGQIQGWASGGN